MQRHPYFDLWIHDDDELAALVGSPIVQRTTLHEWPLSCVQRLTCATGQTHIYKVQAPPTVEPVFYERAHSPLLVQAQLLPAREGPVPLLLEDVEAPRLDDPSFTASARLAMIDDLLAQIGQIAGDLPAVADIRTLAQWLAYGQAVVEDLRALVQEGLFQQVNETAIAQASAHVESPTVIDAIDGRSGYVHGDLWAENVLVADDGYRVVDWQRPIWGPVDLDRITLLESVGIDPAGHVGPGVLELRTLLLIGWFAQAARRWFPAGAPTYDTQIARLIGQLDVGQSSPAR